jgi:putative SOS response-associated peptidase YedK
MCGRFVRITPIPVIAKRFRAKQLFADLAPSYNIAPSQEIVIIKDEGVRQLVQCTWGFVPSWAKDPSIGNKMINARSETVAEKPAFRSAFKKKRCLVIADGFYEWKTEGKRKFPMYIRLKSGECFAFAGLYNVWKAPDGNQVCTCTIITTEAKEDIWINPAVEEKEELLAVLKPYPAEEMETYEVSTKVNFPQHNTSSNIKPL